MALLEDADRTTEIQLDSNFRVQGVFRSLNPVIWSMERENQRLLSL